MRTISNWRCLAIGRDRLGRRFLFLHDACRASGLPGRDFGLFNHAAAVDLLILGLLLAMIRTSATFFSWAMRADSIASRAAMSASSIARLRAISSERTRSSCAIRVVSVASRAAMPATSSAWLRSISSVARALLGGDAFGGERLFARDAGGLDSLLRCDLGLLNGPGLQDLERTGVLVGGDSLGVDDVSLGDARLFGRLAGGDFGFVNRAGTLDLAAACLLFVGDAGVGDDAILLDAGLLDELARLNFGFLDRAAALDFLLSYLAFGCDARGVDRALVGDARFFDFLARHNFFFLDRAGALDFPVAGFTLGGDARFRDGLLIGDARLLDRLACRDLRLFGFGLAQRPFARHFGALHGAANLDVALLIEARGLALALDIERLPLGLQIAGADLDHRILLDVVAQFALGLDVFHQPGQAFGVEAVRRVEEFEVGLVKVGDRDRFQFQAVLGQRLGGSFLDARDIVAALLVHLLHGHFGGDRTHRGDELAGQQRMQPLRLQRPPPKGGRGDRDRFTRWRHPDVEISLDVDAHAIAGDDGVLLRASDRHRQHVHIDGREVVNKGQHEGAAVDHHPLAEEASAHERHFLG